MKFLFLVFLFSNFAGAAVVSEKTLIKYCEKREMGDMFYVKSCLNQVKAILNKTTPLSPSEQATLKAIKELQ